MPPKKTAVTLKTSSAKDELLAHTYTDEVLIAGARRGERAHIGALHRRHQAWLRRKIEEKDKDVTAEGVVNEVFMRLPNALARFEDGGNLKGLLWTIALRILLDRWRRQRREPIAMDPAAMQVKGGGGARRKVERDDLIERLCEGLSPKEARVWRMSAEGIANVDIAAAEGITANNVGVILSRARVKVQASARSMGITRSDLASSGISDQLA
jgi:RNA polymerase sigma factor (sigma-70 family)